MKRLMLPFAIVLVSMSGCAKLQRLHWSATPYVAYNINEGRQPNNGMVGFSLTIHDGTPAVPAVPQQTNTTVEVNNAINSSLNQTQGQAQGQDQTQSQTSEHHGKGKDKDKDKDD